jgi:hypothetical protein
MQSTTSANKRSRSETALANVLLSIAVMPSAAQEVTYRNWNKHRRAWPTLSKTTGSTNTASSKRVQP